MKAAIFRIKGITKRRLSAVLLLLPALAMTIVPTLSGYAYAQAQSIPTEQEVSQRRSTDRNPIRKDASFDLADGIKDARLAATTPAGKQTTAPIDRKLATKPVGYEKGEEKESERTDKARVYKGKNGGELIEASPEDQNYVDKSGKYAPIVKDAVVDEDYQRLNKVPESLLDKILPGTNQPAGLKSEHGSIKTYFETLGKGGVRVDLDGHELVMMPKAIHEVKPGKKVIKNGPSYVEYKDVWKNVDILYEYKGTSLKENIVINKLPETSKFVFDLKGARAYSDPEDPNVMLLDGPFKDRLAIGALTVDVNKKGIISSPPIRQYPNADGTQIVVELDHNWLKSQPKDAFPIVVDPPLYDISGIPGGYWGEFQCHKSDGTNLGSNNCNLNTGGLNDNGPKYWRSTMRIPYDQLNGRQLLAADLYLSMLPPGSAAWPGYYDNRVVNVTWASCNGFHCVSNAPHMSAVVGADGTINVTPLLQWMKDNVGYGGWLILWGEEWHTTSYKAFHGDNVKLHMYTNLLPSQPGPDLPSNNNSQEAVVTTTEPQLRVSKSSDPNGDQVDYQFVLKNTSGSVVWASGWSPSRQVIVPEGVLQDAGKYRWEYYYGDPYWSSGAQYGGSFRVDLLTGKDESQTYDELGPLSVSLNNGNMYTSVKSHAMSALGGDIGVTLDYNSPYLTRKGLEAEYYSNNSLSGVPQYRRVEPNIDYDWDVGSPVTGVIPADNFSVKWTGYFLAPESGEYYFGATNDDAMTVTIKGTQVINFGCCQYPGWSATPVYLEQGEAAEIVVSHIEYGGLAYASLKVKGAVPEQTVPTDWLRTKPMPTNTVKGLTGHYYYDDGSHNPTALTKFLVRDDPSVNFSWATGAPMPGAPSDNFYVHWEGYYTAPTAGTYSFGVGGDDGVKVSIDGVERAALWYAHGYQEQYDPNGMQLAAGQTVRIDMDYFELGGEAKVKLLLNGPNGTGDIDPKYLTRGSKPVPAGWSISGDIDGSLAFERVNIRQNGDALVYDSDGTSWLFANTGSGFTPPKNQDASLVKSADGTYNLTDSDGREYVFNTDGTLRMTSTPADDRNPTALKYEYATQNGVPKLKKIIDPVNTARYGTLYYQGDAGCREPYEGLDAAPPSGMICGFETTDGQYTQFMYYGGQIAVVSNPGWADMSLSYDAQGVLDGFRDVMSEDAVYAGQRPDDEFSYSWIWYDALGRVNGMETAKPTTGGSRIEHLIEYLPNASKRYVVGAPEPAGYTQYIEFDDRLRTTKSCDVMGKCATTEYHPTKDLVLSATNALGLKSTMHYDDEDRLIRSYGPAPVAWFDANREPLPQYASDVQRGDSAYDEGLVGPSVAYYDYEGNISPEGKLYDAPKLHTTGIDTSAPGSMQKTWTTAPVTISAQREGWGASLTGKLRLPTSGTYQIKAAHDDGVRVWIDDQLIAGDWVNGGYRDTTGSFSHIAGQVRRLRIDYYNQPGTPANDGSLSISLKQDGGFDWTTDWSGYLKPGYGLTTGTVTYDADLGNATTVTEYADAAYGLVQDITVDPSGIAYQSGVTHEAPGTGYLRQLTKTLPGGTTTQYTHWAANATADNPCTTATESFKQAGFSKGRIDPDPDGAGSQVARQTESIYDNTGRVVANRIGTDAWTCVTYDDRGRVAKVVIPTVGARAGRTVTYNYANGGNPLATKVTDVEGYTVTTVDLLGRVVKFRDTAGNITDTTYNALGQISQRTSKLGTEQYLYDDYGRLTTYKLDSVVLSTVDYDDYGRVTQVEYPTVKDPATNATLKLNNPTRDDMQRVTGLSYTLPNAQMLSNSVTLSQSGAVLDEAVNGVDLSPGAQAFTYDKAGRLTQAQVAGHTYAYGFGAPDPACSGKAGNYATAGKNSNRTSYSVDGVSSWYCYDAADRLVGSNDAKYDAPTYDTHGNTLTLGTGANTTTFKYDQSDRNTEILQGASTKVTYKRDHANRITQRAVTNSGTTTTYYYGSTGGSNYTFMYTDNVTKQVVEKYLVLPGGVQVTLRPLETASAQKTKASLRNLHGDTFVVLNGDGVNESNILVYEPFGTQIAPTATFTAAHPTLTLAGATPPANVLGSQSAAWAGSFRRTNETSFAVMPIQMGARVYIPGLGRFLQVDSIEGGTLNNYVYAVDPINGSDYSGKLSVTINTGLQDAWGGAGAYLQPASTIASFQQTMTAPEIRRVYSANTRINVPSSRPTPKPYTVLDISKMAIAQRNHFILGDMTKIPQGGGVLPPLPKSQSLWSRTIYPWLAPRFDHAASTGRNWSENGQVIGAGVGCGAGAIAAVYGSTVSFGGTLTLAGIACIEGAEVGGNVGYVTSGGIGFVVGLFTY